MKQLVWLAAVAGAISLAGCGSDTSDTSDSETLGTVTVHVLPDDTRAASLRVTVTAPGMPDVSGQAPVAGGEPAAATLDVPAGPGRTFSVEAVDAEGTVVWQRAVTADVPAGQSSYLPVQ